MTPTASSAARLTRNSPVLRFLARLGYAVNGLLHALIGFIAIKLAFGASGEADQSGALSALAATPLGVFILWTVFGGLAALGLWLILSAFLTAPQSRGKRWRHLLPELGKGLAYLSVAATTFTFARGGSTNSASSTTKLSAGILALPGGVVLVALIGLLIVAVGVYFVVKGVTQRFVRDLTLPSGSARKAIIATGIFGYVAKGVVLVVVGILFCVAAATLDPAKSSGLDGGLKALGAVPFGKLVLVIVGLGLIAYAIYSAVRARYAKL